jgi:hypothetical protein
MNATTLDYRGLDWVSDALGLEQKDVVDLLESGILPGVKLGSKWIVSQGALEEFVREEEARQVQGRRSIHSTDSGRRSPMKRRPGGRLEAVDAILHGKRISAANMTALVLKVIQRLAEQDPGFLDRFSLKGGRERRYVATDPADLFSGRADLASRYSKEIKPGWWLGTNYSRRELETLLERACTVAGLGFGADLILAKPRRTIDRQRALAFVGLVSDPDPDASSKHDELFVEAVLDEQR